MKTVISMLAALTIIGIASGGGLAKVDEWARPLIAANKKAATERAIFLVQPTAKSYEHVGTVEYELYRVFDETKNTIGYALPWEGNGFQGKIRMMVGVSADLQSLSAIEVLEQVETPGLGTKVTEPPFCDQFKRLNADPAVEWVKGVPPTKENEIQAITGATISSKAIVEIVNNGLAALRASMQDVSVQEGGAQ